MKIVSEADASIPSSSKSRKLDTSSQTPFSKSRFAADTAAPKPAIPITFSVPDLRPISCPPPPNISDTSVPDLTTRAPTPLGPPIL